MANIDLQKVCFGTLALGDNYCALALELAKDIAKYSSQTPLVVLTDKPHYFKDEPNVLAFKHRQQSIGCYHDKRCVIAQALSLFNSCIFIDADMRILAPITQDLKWQPGITGLIVWKDILKHNKNSFELALLKEMADKLNLNLEEISFVHECLFVVTRDRGKENDFLQEWKRIAPYFELRGFYRGEGHTIGLAAAKVGFSIRRDSMEGISFFKDKLTNNKIKKEGISTAENINYLEIQRKLEYPQKSIFKKISDKTTKMLGYFYRSLQLRLMTLQQFDFYYRQATK